MHDDEEENIVDDTFVYGRCHLSSNDSNEVQQQQQQQRIAAATTTTTTTTTTTLPGKKGFGSFDYEKQILLLNPYRYQK